ncbi:T9SS type A sorting domain-containing protein [Chryseolinea lacunae]|uniref:T9SS type A sorting domain-containing protein n=1 Tax=Chryseolinea lacunae TaxID=2801331 RepID=A0ABS1KP47_9BACT|nr:T9SS type A sorting domain-containing protein [Chryseolinea lacunae]MBL0740467.1 T9SS type A sorting domain-containing protein [Chryseolinea lacunae]
MKSKLLVYGMMVGAALIGSAYKGHDGKPRWYGNDHFKINHRDNVVTVAMAKMPWESFSVDLEDLRASEGVIAFEVKSKVPVTLRADGFTRNNTQVELFNEQLSGDAYQQVSYTFSGRDAGISHILFYVDPGKEFHGDLEFRNVQSMASTEGAVIRTFPNPTSGEITVQLPDNKFNLISLYDAAGNVVLTRQPDGLTTKINLANQRAGLYLLKARSNTAMLTTKIIVEQ